MTIQEPKNKGYAAVVVSLQSFVDLTNCDNVKAALIFGNSVIVSKGLVGGEVGLYFPVECQLDKAFLGANNLFRKSEWGNVEADKKGFFEEHGRVKAVKFRGNKSEGFWIPIESLAYTGIPLSEIPLGAEFDALGDHKICCKYIPVQRGGSARGVQQGRQPRAEDRIVAGQFRFHIDTENLRRNVHQIRPDNFISISDKWHGSSAIVANLMIKRELPWYERALRRLGVSIAETQYGITWSSRRVVKGVDGEAKANSIHCYGTDVWGDVAREVAPLIPKGFTVYGEIVGFTSDGGAIQKGYHYGCQAGTHRFLVYRVTNTNPDGKVIELSWLQMRAFCASVGLDLVKEFFYGRASDLLPYDSDQDIRDWQHNLLAFLELTYIKDEMCAHNNREVPAEGIVVRVEKLDEAPSFKLKNWRFLEAESKQLDEGAVDMETEQSII